MTGWQKLRPCVKLTHQQCPSASVINSSMTNMLRKFATEQRVGSLASGFAVLAIFISCLGLFGMASFMAEQRTKGDWRTQSARRDRFWTVELIVEGFCKAGCYITIDRYTHSILLYEQLVTALYLSRGYILVDICGNSSRRHFYHAGNS